MSWRAHLRLRYRRDGPATVGRDAHEGPLRVLRSLHPEGPAIGHHVIVHPPGGIVGGDELLIDADVGAGAHAVLTTPGATRFYRSDGASALQCARLAVGPSARLEWLPLETIAHAGCQAENRVELQLEPGGEALGWDLLALGLPASGESFDRGRFVQHLAVGDHWLERGVIDAADEVLLASPVGMAGRRLIATLWFAAGHDLDRPAREALLESARAAACASPLAATAGATAPHPRVVVLRVLADRVEPAMALLLQVRKAWRRQAWQLDGEPLRIWRT